MSNKILTNFITGTIDFNTTIKIIKNKLIKEIKKDIKQKIPSNSIGGPL